MGRYLTEKERYQIEAWLMDDIPVKEIAMRLGKCLKTIYNEIHRGTVEMIDYNLIPYKKYCADAGQRIREERGKNKGIDLKAADNVQLLSYISHLIVDLRFSPYVAALLVKKNHDITICECTIYNYIRRGLIPGVTMKQMAYKPRKKKKEEVKRLPRKKIYPSISERPAEVESRDIFGHWEMDTVYSGKGCSKVCLLVLTERCTRHELLFRMGDRTAASTVRTLDRLERSLGRKEFREMFKTITCDNGNEFADYEGITKHNRTQLFYCHPYSSWERGSNENQNKFVRRWIPKGDDIGLYSKKDIERIQNWINALPRKKFSGLSSNELVNLYKEPAQMPGS